MKPKTLTFAMILLAALVVRGDDRPAKINRIFVPIIKAEGLSRNEALVMTELMIKGIERDTASKVVGSPDEADLILEATVKPGGRVAR